MNRGSIARLILDGFWVLVLGVIVCFVFFVAIGGIDPTQATGASIVVGVLAILYLAHAWAQNHRRTEERDRRLVAARERRGF
jgi:hypothetical protein